MIVHERYAENRLMETLEALKLSPAVTRCIHLNLAGQRNITGINQAVIDAAKHYISSEQTQIFFCNDGDIFVISPGIHQKEYAQFIQYISERVALPPNAALLHFHQVSIEIHKLLLIAENKIKAHEQAIEETHKQQEEAKAEARKNAILNSIGENKADFIKSRREGRHKSEFMIIEDDPFSRKLVENVLQKQHALTGLGEATHALDTYTVVAPDLLFLDINLPDVSGQDLLLKILSIDPDAYVIMLSGNADRENILQAMSHGAKGFIAKPFTREKIFQYIDRCPTLTLRQSHAYPSSTRTGLHYAECNATGSE